MNLRNTHMRYDVLSISAKIVVRLRLNCRACHRRRSSWLFEVFDDAISTESIYLHSVSHRVNIIQESGIYFLLSSDK